LGRSGLPDRGRDHHVRPPVTVGVESKFSVISRSRSVSFAAKAMACAEATLPHVLLRPDPPADAALG
jgi:hypothetical protein